MIIDRKDWKIHPEVIAFWEKQGKVLECYGEWATYEGPEIGFAVYQWKLDKPQFFRFPRADPNVIAYHDVYMGLRYKLNGIWYYEEHMLRLLKLKAFL